MKNDSSAAEDRMEEELEKRDYFTALMHEFISNRFPLHEKIALVESIRRMNVLPAEVVDYRLRCLKGEDPGTPPDFIFNYGPTGRIRGGRPDWACVLTWYGEAEGRNVGITPEEAIEKRVLSPDQMKEISARELRGFMEAGREMMREYYGSGADRLYPEYTPIWEAEKIRIQEMQKSIDRRSKVALRRRRTDRTVDFTA